MFSGALVGILSGSQFEAGLEMSPLDATHALVGSREMGPDWDLAIVPERLLASSPAEGTVRTYSIEEDTDLRANDAIGILEGENVLDSFGASITPVPDFDGDGTADLVVGAPTFNASISSRQDGAAYFLSGLGEGFTGRSWADNARLRVVGENVGGRLGSRVTSCGDVDGDGLSDWLTAATWDQSGADLGGLVVVALSDRLPDLDEQVLAGAVGPTWTGSIIGEKAGQAIACGQDLDGDGTTDLLIGAPFADNDDGNEAVGRVYFIQGSQTLDSGSLSSRADRILEETQDQAWFGWSIATGDLNGDLSPEVIVGAPGADDGAGRVQIWDGADFIAGETSARLTISGENPGDGFGRSVTAADLNGDGIDELIIGAPFTNPTDEDSAYDSGTLYVFFSADDYAGWSLTMSGSDASVQVSEPQQYLRTGQLVRSGDVDQDGRMDLAILHRAEPP